MTIQEAIRLMDETKPNAMSLWLKIKNLTTVEQLIHSEVVMRHVHTPAQAVRPEYTEETDPQTELIIPDPYSDVYVKWLMCEVDRQNQEDGRYNVDRAHFENAWDTMADWYTRTHRPIQFVREFRV